MQTQSLNGIQDNWQAIQIARRLIDVGTALSAESNLERLFSLIVVQARQLTSCDAASIYIRETDQLRFFVVSQNEVLRHQVLPLNTHSIAGYVVLTGQILNIPDVYVLDPSLPYTFNREFDRLTGYRTRSMLTVPMRDNAGQVIGALQLLNRLSPKRSADSGLSFESSFGGPPHPEVEGSFSAADISIAEALASQATVAYQNMILRQELKAAHIETIFCLAAAAEYRDNTTSWHLKRMSHYSRIIAKNLGLSEAEQDLILYASPMHDIGKIGIPDAILLKPGKFTPEDRQIMQKHPEIGAEILRQSDSELMRKSAIIALSHHEKYDGSGYPRGLKGEEIPIEGRIVALADVFDALASKRPYKKAWTLEDIFELIDQSNGTHFDPKIVAAFYRGKEEILEVYHRFQEPDQGGM